MTHTTEEISSLPGVSRVALAPGGASFYIAPAMVRTVIRLLRDRFGFIHLSFLTAVDRVDENLIELVYALYSYSEGLSLTARVELGRAAPGVETISDIFRTADWHERETAEMFGVKFLNHPDPRRLLLPEGVNAPLRKDYTNKEMIPLPH